MGGLSAVSGGLGEFRLSWGDVRRLIACDTPSFSSSFDAFLSRIERWRRSQCRSIPRRPLRTLVPRSYREEIDQQLVFDVSLGRMWGGLC